VNSVQDQRREDQQQRQVEAAEQRRVPVGERGEQAGSGDDQPRLVHVPHGADRVDHDAAVDVVAAAQHRQQHPDAEVEALQHEVAAEQEADQGEPELGQRHGVLLPTVG
jgi:hypothetical protein